MTNSLKTDKSHQPKSPDLIIASSYVQKTTF
jgi:hypothetical protein